MSKPWGNKIGAWAADSERAEAEELAAAAAAPPPTTTFPSLREAAAVAPKPKGKKKGTIISLHEFSSMSTSSHSGGGGGLTTAELLRLPTGPKERSQEEMMTRGGFSGYGGGGGRFREEREGGGGRRPYGGGYDNERSSGPPRGSEFDNMPSRADEVDNWGVGKRTNMPSFDSGRTANNKYTSLGAGVGGSRADDVDNWGAGKRVSAPAPVRERSGFGSGFHEPGLGGLERKRLVLDPPKKDVGPGGPIGGSVGLDGSVGGPVVGSVGGPVKANKPSPFGAARPREEVLAEKGLDWKKMEMDIEAKKTSRPTSAHSSRPTSSQSNRSENVGVGMGVEGVVKARPKVNPFGDAKPREVLLQEKGLDWRKIDLDLDHRRVDRTETEEEKILKEEIDRLKKESADQSVITSKERDLEMLIRELDDKVRFAPRPGSGAGRVSGPHSRSESFDEYRNPEFVERPRSRGHVDMWSRQTEERRGFQGGERGFMGNRGMDRPRSRDRW